MKLDNVRMILGRVGQSGFAQSGDHLQKRLAVQMGANGRVPDHALKHVRFFLDGFYWRLNLNNGFLSHVAQYQ